MRRILLAGLLLCGLARAQSRPDFSGVWKMDAAKCEFGALPPVQARTDTIDHRDPNMKATTRQVDGNGDNTVDRAFTTDGKETTVKVMGNDRKMTARWDGDVLVVETKLVANGNAITITDRWTVSKDNAILTISRHFAADGLGETDQKLVMEKQKQ